MVGTALTAQPPSCLVLSQFNPHPPGPTYVLIHGLGDELALAVDAGVGSLASNLLLLFGNAPRRRRTPTSVQRA